MDGFQELIAARRDNHLSQRSPGNQARKHLNITMRMHEEIGWQRNSKSKLACLIWLGHTPNTQFTGSSISSDIRLSLWRKNGRRMRYAFERSTSGKTLRVPCVGAVSLSWRRQISTIFKLRVDFTSGLTTPEMFGRHLPEIQRDRWFLCVRDRIDLCFNYLTWLGRPYNESLALSLAVRSYGSCFFQSPFRISL